MEKRNYVKPHFENSYFITNNTFLAVSLNEEGGTITESESFIIQNMTPCSTGLGTAINDFVSETAKIIKENGTYGTFYTFDQNSGIFNFKYNSNHCPALKNLAPGNYLFTMTIMQAGSDIITAKLDRVN